MRKELQNAYINEIIDGMDFKSLTVFVYDHLDENLNKYTEEELIKEIKEHYPHLLGGE